MNDSTVIGSAGSSPFGVAKPTFPSLPSRRAFVDERKAGSFPVDTQDTPSQGSEAKEGLATSKVEAAVTDLNAQLQFAGRSLRFQIHEEADLIVVSVIDDETGETVRQVPAEVTVKLAESSQDLRGLLTNVEG